VNRDLFFQAANTRALGRDQVPQVWSVSQVNTLARELLESTLPLFWVAGEVSGFKRYPSGHCYFSLKDSGAQLNCVMWRDQARGLPAEPPEGMEVHAFGYLSIYERAGRFQFVARKLTAQGEGLWRVAFEKAREKLESDGLLDPDRKQPLPAFPGCVGIVTSLEGAAVRDIVSVIGRRAPWTDLLIYPTRVQGDGAPAEIINAVRRASQTTRADVLIVGRGGGSLEDLQAFNEETVARAIAASRVPVISAVGHEADVTLCDLVADRRAATPSAAAELAVPDGDRLRDELTGRSQRMAAALRNGLKRGARRVARLEDRLIASVTASIERRRNVVEGFKRRLTALGPMEVLERGYAVALDADGRILRSVDSFQTGKRFTLRIKDGQIIARVEDVGEGS
jgi:exodeoxyribonuclease VII large subunit